MNIIYDRATKIAFDAKTAILRLDVQFNFVFQNYMGYVELANGKKCKIFADGTIEEYD